MLTFGFFSIPGQTLVREWCKFRYGTFPEHGLAGDRLYPAHYKEGNRTLDSKGCLQRDPLCPLGQVYNRDAPTKQNLLCQGESAIETVLNHPDFQVTWQTTESPSDQQNVTAFPPSTYVLPATVKVATDPTFDYIVPRSNRYVLLLDRTSMMGVNGRWTNIKRAFFRFINNLPVGSELSIISFDSKEAIVNLPPTVVTDNNREGLHGRIPRKVDHGIRKERGGQPARNTDEASNDIGCTFCALNASLNQALTNYVGETDSGTIVLVTGAPEKPAHLDRILTAVKDTPLQVFPILYPSTAHPDLMKLGAIGGGLAYSVPEGEEGLVSPLTFMTEILLDILRESETDIQIQKVHETRHMSYEFAGTFTMEEDILHEMSVTLSVDDEDKVEFFEITNPSGKKHLFSKFEDGMVVFNHPGLAESGIWSYHAKLYPNSGLPGAAAGSKMTVDVVSHANNVEAEPIVMEVFTDVDQAVEVDVYGKPVVIFARITKGDQIPVLDARVVATLFKPGGDIESSRPTMMTLHDNGAGYPDVTADDGIYSAYFEDFATVPGFYSIRVLADNNDGLARTPKIPVSPAVIENSTTAQQTLDNGKLSLAAL